MSVTTFYSKHYSPTWPPVPLSQWSDPDSAYWQAEAEFSQGRFEREAPAFLSEADFYLFAGWITAQDGLTYKRLSEIYRQALEYGKPGAAVAYLGWICGILPEGPEKERIQE